MSLLSAILAASNYVSLYGLLTRQGWPLFQKRLVGIGALGVNSERSFDNHQGFR